jgi:uncharacterized protein (TIGR00661 family)
MKYLFVVQGEGRGHLTQALSLKSLLEKNGHEVVSILVGSSKKRSLPDFFVNKTQNILVKFQSPNFMPLPKEKRPFLLTSIIYNLLLLPVFIESIFTIKKTISEKQPDIVVNFYELLCGITYGVFSPTAPMVNVAHQYYFLTSNFKYTGKKKLEFSLLNFYSRFTALNASKILALSFRNEETEQYEEICIVPPLLRKEVYTKSTQSGNYIHGYMLNDGYVNDLKEWSTKHPTEKLHFFWDKKFANSTTELSDNLTMHRLDDVRFLKFMSGAKAYATTGGFESVCEAIYLQKPVLMVPTHIEQECNVIDALNSGIGVSNDNFNLDSLVDFVPFFKPNKEFRYWANAAENIFLSELTSFELCEDNVYVAI